MSERHVFASPGWLAYMGQQLEALAARHRNELDHANYIMCQHYTGGPAALGTTAWWFRAMHGELRWGIGTLPSEACDCFVQAPYTTMAEAAMVDTSTPEGAARLQAALEACAARGELVAFDAPDRRPPFLFQMHDILARITRAPDPS